MPSATAARPGGRTLRGAAPSAQRQSLPHRGRGTAKRWMRQTPKVSAKPGFSLISRLRDSFPRGKPRGCAPCPRPTQTALAFPHGGRCHGKAVTDEGRGQVGVSATPEEEVQTLISHQCAPRPSYAVGHGLPAVPPMTHLLRWFRRSAVRNSGTAGRPCPTGCSVPLASPEIRGGGPRSGGGVFRRAGSPERTPQSRYARQLPLQGSQGRARWLL